MSNNNNNNNDIRSIEKAPPRSSSSSLVEIDMEDMDVEGNNQSERRRSSILRAGSSFLRRVSGISNGDTDTADIEHQRLPKSDDDDTVDSDDVESSGANEDFTPTKSQHSTRKLVLISLLLLLVGLGVGLGLNREASSEVAASSSTSTTSSSTEPPSEQTASNTQEPSQEKTTILDDTDCFPDFDPSMFRGEEMVQFPCLLGMRGDEAASILEAAYPNELDIYILEENSPVTMDLRFNRVRIFVSQLSQIVVQVPFVG